MVLDVYFVAKHAHQVGRMQIVAKQLICPLARETPGMEQF